MQRPSFVQRVTRFVGPMIVLLLFCLALWAMRRILHEYRWRDIHAAFVNLPSSRVAIAVLLTAGSFGVLTLYDALALRYIRASIPYRRFAPVSLVAFALGNSISPGAISAGAVRYRVYTTWGINPLDIARILTFCSTASIMGMLSMAGLGLLAAPDVIAAHEVVAADGLRAMGVLPLAAIGGYWTLVALIRRPLRFRDHTLELPSLRLAIPQVFIGFTDYALAGAVLYVLLPSGDLSFTEFAGIYAGAVALGMVSHVPGGLGVFESVVVALLSSRVPADEALAALVAYRVIYYLVPLALAGCVALIYETRQRTESAFQRLGQAMHVLAPVTPTLYAAAVFAGGLVLLVSGALPALYSRVEVLKSLVSLPLVEASHFLASVAGILLVVLARGLQRRVDAAYYLSCALLALAAVLSLLKGLDYEEATIMAVLLAGLLPARKQFRHRASILAPRWSPGWVVAVGLAVASSTALGFFVHKHVEYRQELWWQFEYTAHASRFLRAEVGVLVAVFGLSIARLFAPRVPKPHPPAPEEIDAAAHIVAQSQPTYAYLALLGDKSFLFNADATAFVMYAVEGRSWISMGDPVGPEDARDSLIWSFRELAEGYGGWPVFYQVSAENVHEYIDAGFECLKVGEDARVDLQQFSLQGGHRKDERNHVNRFEKAGATFRVVPCEDVPAMMDSLREVSDDWLGAKSAREKGFSLGFFDESYLVRCPIAVIEVAGRIVAFTNLWTGADKQELSVDLMRYRADAPPGAMDYLFIKTMLWGKEQGYRFFGLGMAPLAGLEERRAAPLWNKVAGMVYRHGENFYNFQGLRHYKEKFDPEWQPRYLASPGGLAIPKVLTNLVTLISGGVTGILRK